MQGTKKGFLVSLEGLDGAGKTTQLKLLKTWFLSEGYPLTQQKIYTPLREITRDLVAKGLDALSHCLLSAAKHQVSFNRVINPELERGSFVVTDRYIDTSIVYSIADGIPEAFVKHIYSLFREPDLTIFLDIAPSKALERKHSMGGIDLVEQGKFDDAQNDPEKLFLDHQEKAYAQYIHLLRNNSRFIGIKGDRDLHEVHNDIKEAILAAIHSVSERSDKIVTVVTVDKA